MSDTKRAVTFSQNISHRIAALGAETGAGFEDVSARAGHYDRDTFLGTIDQWDAIHAALAVEREAESGHVKASYTSAMSRIWTSDKQRASDAARSLRLHQEGCPISEDSKNDPRVIAIRNDSRVGLGSCTYIDECFDADELVEALDEWHREPITDPTAAVTWARDFQKLKLDQATNASSGEEDCPLIAAYDAWVAGEVS